MSWMHPCQLLGSHWQINFEILTRKCRGCIHARQLQAVTVKILLKYLDVMDASMPALDSQNPFEILS